MKLFDLWAKHGDGEPLPGPPDAGDLFIFGVTDDSRDVRYGYLFCALPGSTEHGLTFCAQAALKGDRKSVV